MSDTIIVLSDIEKIRQRPGTYVGDDDKLGLETIVREIFDNGVDEYPNYPDKEKPIILTLQKGDIMSVRDYGRGISPYRNKARDEIEERLAYTLMGAGGKFRENREQNGNQHAGGLNGIGACATNAFSEYFDVEIWKDGYYFFDHYEDGIPLTPLDKTGNLPKKKLDVPETGTKITFKPSSKYLRTTKIDASKLEITLQQAAYLNPGLRIQFTNERDDEEESVFYSKNGLLDYLSIIAVDENGSPASFLIKPFLIHGTAEAEVKGRMNEMEANIAVAFARGETFAAKAFTNGIENSSGGTHLQGCYQGVIELLYHYWEEFFSEFSSKYKIQLELIRKVNNLSSIKDVFKLIKPRNIARKMYIILDFKHNDPILTPQTKDTMSSAEAKPAMARIFYEKASLYLDKNIPAVQELIGFLVKELHEKAKAEDTTINLSKSDLKLAVSSKLAAAKSKDPKKKVILIVEGDSAAGSIKENRDSRYQAVLPLRGKILNAKRTTLARLLANPEIATFITAVGTGIGSKYDESKLQYDKIILTTDQDVDGLHIQILLLVLILTYMPDLIRNGHVYILETPLYVNKWKGNHAEEIYCYSEEEQTAFLEKNKGRIGEVQRNKGLGELTKEQVIKTILTPETRHLIQLTMKDEDAIYNLAETLMGKDVTGRKQLFIKER